MSVLTAIRKQENPDGIEGHKERLEMQEESKTYVPKRTYTKKRHVHYYTEYKFIGKDFFTKERLLQAKDFCRTLCCNNDCPLRGV